MATITIPRSLGGTLILTITPAPSSAIVPNILLAVRQGTITLPVRKGTISMKVREQ